MMLFLKAHHFFRKRRSRGRYVNTNGNLRQGKLKTKDMQNGGEGEEKIGCIRGVLLEMCH